MESWDIKQPDWYDTVRRLESRISNYLFRLYCPVKKSETRSALKSQARGKQVQGQERSEGVTRTTWEEADASSERLENNSRLLGPQAPPIFILGSKSVCHMAAGKWSASAQMPAPISGWRTAVSQPNAAPKITAHKMLPYGRRTEPHLLPYWRCHSGTSHSGRGTGARIHTGQGTRHALPHWASPGFQVTPIPFEALRKSHDWPKGPHAITGVSVKPPISPLSRLPVSPWGCKDVLSNRMPNF